MAASMRTLKERIRSAQSTGKITKSMKMVSASKLRKTQKSMQSLLSFSENCSAILSMVLSGTSDAGNPYLTRREVKKTCYVAFVGNRGLCGVYNNAVAKYLKSVTENDDSEISTVVVGRWGRDSFASNRKLNVIRFFDEVGDTPGSKDAAVISTFLKELYISGAADRIVLVYQSFSSVLAQAPCEKVLLPVSPAVSGNGEREYIFEPNKQSLIDSLTELYIDNTVLAVLLEAKTGEHASRMTAMTAATDNTEELIADLSLKLNHARQAAITTEITEIVGGASALNNN